MNSNGMSIKWKLFFYLMIFVAAMLVILWLFQTVLLDNFYKSIKVSQIKGYANTLSENLDSENLQQLIDHISREDNIRVTVVSDNGMTIYTTNPLQFENAFLPGYAHGIASLIKMANENGGVYVKRSPGNPDDRNYNNMRFEGHAPHPNLNMPETIIYAKSTVAKNNDKMYIVIESTITPVNATVETLRMQLLIVSAILAVLALFLALFISKKIAAPIMDINKSAKRLAVGEYDVTFTGNGFCEINELNGTLNTAAKELSKVEGLRQELIANVSHDLRTPLTMITGFAEMMRDIPGENSPENVQIIINEANRLNRLVSDLLDISKVQSGEALADIKNFNITQNVYDVISRLTPLSDGISINFRHENDIFVTADESQITQVVYNLMSNALNYANSKIEIRQIAKSESVRIEVCDDGEGISDSDLPYIWDRYYKVDKSHKRAQAGTGLGLSIVRKIIQSHGGIYGVLNGAGGTVFWFEIHQTNPHLDEGVTNEN